MLYIYTYILILSKYLYIVENYLNYNRNYKLSKVDFIFSCSDATLVAFFIFCLAFNIIRLAPVTVFAYFFSFFHLFSSFSLAQSILRFLPLTFSSLRYLHIHLISLVSMLASVSLPHARPS